jgi:hypothetical protein
LALGNPWRCNHTLIRKDDFSDTGALKKSDCENDVFQEVESLQAQMIIQHQSRREIVQKIQYLREIPKIGIGWPYISRGRSILRLPPTAGRRRIATMRQCNVDMEISPSKSEISNSLLIRMEPPANSKQKTWRWDWEFKM